MSAFLLYAGALVLFVAACLPMSEDAQNVASMGGLIFLGLALHADATRRKD